MKLKFATEAIDKSIFLAGPTPRDENVPSWRPEAIGILRELEFDGTVFIPESADWAAKNAYDDQVHWEWEGLNQATVAIFWVPRTLDLMPAFTTNIEFGLVAASGKAILGYPQEAPKMRYLESLAKRFKLPVVHNLRVLLQMAVERTKQPFGGHAK